MQKTYRLENLSCTSCAAKFEKNIRALPEINTVNLNFGASKLTVDGNVSIADLEKAGAFDHIRVYPEKAQVEHVPFYKRRQTIETALSFVLMIIGIIVSFQTSETDPRAIGLFGASIAVGGYGMFWTGLKNLTKFQFDMKTLMTIAIIGAVIIGEWREGAVVVFLFAVSEALEAFSMNKARQSIRGLMDLAPARALIQRNGELLELDTEDIQVGDMLIVKPGQKIAMDGTVLRGNSSVNQAAITGESIPALKQQGDEVFAGTFNEEGALEVHVTKRVEDTTIAKIIHLVEEAQAEKAPSQQFVDRFAKYYTPAIIVIAFLVAIVPGFATGNWDLWVYQGLAVLVVGCPCALVVSTPVAIVTAIGNAARQGVLIKGGIHLEETGRIQAIAFDKTGTLTKGYPEMTDVFAEHGYTEDEVVKIAASVETMSQHPLARAITVQANGVYDYEDFQSLTGKGASALVNGIRVSVGSLDWAEEEGFKVPAHYRKLQESGKSVTAVFSQMELIGAIAVADAIRKESPQIIRTLKDMGIQRTIMLTGDHTATANAIAANIGMTDVRAGLMPEDKLSAIKELQQKYGRVAMIGDGVNDAPALAASTVGIAMGGAGTDAALETADIALMADDLEKLPYTIRLSRKTLRIIKENIIFALGLKIIALLLIIPGWLTLWIAIFADMGATLLVILNALRLVKVQK
ncbi:heavy metal translocating P-type ATPase [Planococcus sp. N028]|uniref:Cd(2+)-exporting ATPase n=1 Tax=Planococcus shixiaomingii TaxID=3058393 RepID=A0ABT8N631_9BACL|nr:MULTISPECIES: heavy metal translocating P-type ATPase [unclassified Planococcus (in: firmicutes)]MDN7243344.1 heavy metal translocating P-type ATPase [Planococcus sp. N028]WKA55285.1 heavy metal translocating P-type ATPase [Planococcus sp. N022]